MSVRLKDAFGTAYIAPHHAVELNKFLTENGDVDIAGCKIAFDAMKLIDIKLAERKNIFDSEDRDREDVLRQARERALIDTSIAIELPKLEEISMFVEYTKGLDDKVEYTVKLDYQREYLYPLLTLLNLYRPSVVIQIADKYFELALYISKTLYRRGCTEILKSTKEFIIVTPVDSREIIFNAPDTKTPVYVHGYGEISFENLTAKAIVLPKYFGRVVIHKNPQYSELWYDVKEVALNNLKRYFHIRRESIKSFIGGD